jgi:hypothetical protein
MGACGFLLEVCRAGRQTAAASVGPAYPVHGRPVPSAEVRGDTTRVHAATYARTQMRPPGRCPSCALWKDAKGDCATGKISPGSNCDAGYILMSDEGCAAKCEKGGARTGGAGQARRAPRAPGSRARVALPRVPPAPEKGRETAKRPADPLRHPLPLRCPPPALFPGHAFRSHGALSSPLGIGWCNQRRRHLGRTEPTRTQFRA